MIGTQVQRGGMGPQPGMEHVSWVLYEGCTNDWVFQQLLIANADMQSWAN